jgi:hypothetical protein
MKKQNSLRIKVRDLDPLKDVTGGRRHGHRLHAGAFKVQHGDEFRGFGPLRTQQAYITDKERAARMSFAV